MSTLKEAPAQGHPAQLPPCRGGEAEVASSCTSSDGDNAHDEQWDDWEDGSNEAEEKTRSLFDPATVLSSPLAALEHDVQQHQFDLRQLVAKASLDEYGVIQCINYIRSEVAGGRDPRPALAAAISSAGSSNTLANTAPWVDERYLKPVLEDDPLLWHDFGGLKLSQGEGVTDQNGVKAGTSSKSVTLQQLEAENAALRQALVDLRAALMPPELEEAAHEYNLQAGSSGAGLSSDTTPTAHMPVAASTAAGLADVTGRPAADDVRQVRHVDERYFESYGGLSIHYDMLSDKPRTESYRQALEANPDLIRGKAVLDVGCGTGILSMFAARGGAQCVTSVDGSKRIAEFARQIVKANSLGAESGGPISVLCGKVEELSAAIPQASMDIIVSEWMGYALLFESMLDTVLYARDNFLKPGGAVLPDVASIHIAGANSAASGLDFWKDVHGFSMAPLADALFEGQLRRGNVLAVQAKDLVTHPVMVQELDLCTMKAEEQDFTAEFTLLPSSSGTETCCSVVLWFDVDFSARYCTVSPVKLSTSPSVPVTHWSQTVLLLPKPVVLAGTDAASSASAPASAKVITGRISMVRSLAKHRSLDISLEYHADLSNGDVVAATQLYFMNVTTDE